MSTDVGVARMVTGRAAVGLILAGIASSLIAILHARAGFYDRWWVIPLDMSVRLVGARIVWRRYVRTGRWW